MKKKRTINKMVRKKRTSKRKKLNSKRSDLKKNYTNRKKKNISINISSKLNRTKHKKRLRKHIIMKIILIFHAILEKKHQFK